MDPEIKALFQVLIESQSRTDKTLTDLIRTVDQYVDMANSRTTRIEEAHLRMDESITRYIDSADARMKRIEENLDALIRAITSEHTNGRGRR